MKWLQQCTVAELQAVAKAIGSNSGGKKAILLSNIQADLQHNRFALNGPAQTPFPSQARQHKILSIDMGIRNLAMCTVALPDRWTSKSKPALPIIQTWERIAISKKAIPGSSGDGSESMAAVAKEAFDPSTYAQHAYNLVAKHILPSQPTQILIERQRFRSMGGSAVQEWTLRVNMFEAMIYATLKAFSEQKLWTGSVHPVAPSKVSQFWLGGGVKTAEKPMPKSRDSSARTKAAKVALVNKWLGSGHMFEVEGQAADVAQVYTLRSARSPAKDVAAHSGDLEVLRERVPYAFGKLDDLADCLLQAMAWIRWESNRRAFVAGERGLEDVSLRSVGGSPSSRKGKKIRDLGG